jgi:hypothetical protein
MVVETLTSEMMDAGARLVRKLDASGIPPDAAFWLYSPDSESWKLILVEVQLARQGPRAGYSAIQKVLAKYADELSGLTLQHLVLERPDARIVSLLRKALRTAPGVSGVRFKSNVIDGTLVDDAYVYRVA